MNTRHAPWPDARQALMQPATSAATTLASAIYEGRVRHRRHLPHAHRFGYRVAMLFIDLDELPALFSRRWLWSLERRNVAQFRRSDYLAPDDIPLDETVRLRVLTLTGSYPRGPIRLLTHLRYFGYVFNPVSFYYCYDEDGHTLRAILAEITNTPWNQRHCYALSLDQAARSGRALHWKFAKGFHVSPFMPMDCDYDWRFTAPAEDLLVHMSVSRDGERQFDASLHLQRRALDGAGLRRVLLRYPAMTLQIITAIHWQALRLWLRRNPVYDHPEKTASKQVPRSGVKP